MKQRFVGLTLITIIQIGGSMWNSNQIEAIFKKIDAYQDQMIELQKRLTAIPAIGPRNQGQGEAKKAAYLRDYFQKIGLVVEEYNAPDSSVPDGYRPNLVARLKGISDERTIWLMTHMDVVPEGARELWQTDPFCAEVREGKIYGRGVEDNQQEMVASIFAVKALIELGLKPYYNVGLVLVADEETGSKYGIGYLLANYNIFKPNDLIIVPDAGNPTGTQIEIAEKSIVWLKIRTLGKQCHGSDPAKGKNAHRAGANLLCRIDKTLHEIYNAKDSLFDPPITTIEPTKKEANVPNINTIPGEDVFYFDCRVLPQYDINELLEDVKTEAQAIEKEFGVTVEVSTEQFEQAAPPTRADAPVVKMLGRAIKDVYGVEAKPKGIGGGTVAAFFRRAGYDAAVWGKFESTAHQPNEYCVISNMVNDAKVYAHIFGQQVTEK
ncbi:MAG: M20 family metallo-hydrolase [candidate division WOR-3 bacterium]